MNKFDEKEKPEQQNVNDGEDMLSAINMIESVLREEETEKVPADTTFSLPLIDILRIIPDKYLKQPLPEISPSEKIEITIDDLFTQLARGKVNIKLADMAYFIPSHLLLPSAFNDKETLLSIPLQLVVQSLGPEAFAKRTTKTMKIYDVADIADPFHMPSIKPSEASIATSESTIKQQVAEKSETLGGVIPATEEVTVPQNEIPSTQVSVESTAPTPMPEIGEQKIQPSDETKYTKTQPAAVDTAAKEPAPSAVIPLMESDFVEFPGCVNINTATLEELTSVPGLTEPIARKIIEWRNEHGSFSSIFDVCTELRISRKIFRLITGMSYNSKKEHRRMKLSALLDITPSSLNDLNVITENIVKAGGFSGCAISDTDGLILAEKGTGHEGETFSAIAPKTIRQIMENIQLLSLDHLNSVSISIKDILYTIIPAHNVVITFIHDENKISKSQLLFARKVTKEVSWLLSKRIYAGPPQK